MINQLLIRSEQKKCWLVLGLVWQLIRMHLFRQININEVDLMTLMMMIMIMATMISSTQVPGLVNLLKEGETLADLMKLGPEEILLRWVNYQLEKVGGMMIMTMVFSPFPLIIGRFREESEELDQ